MRCNNLKRKKRTKHTTSDSCTIIIIKLLYSDHRLNSIIYQLDRSIRFEPTHTHTHKTEPTHQLTTWRFTGVTCRFFGVHDFMTYRGFHHGYVAFAVHRHMRIIKNYMTNGFQDGEDCVIMMNKLIGIFPFFYFLSLCSCLQHQQEHQSDRMLSHVFGSQCVTCHIRKISVFEIMTIRIEKK